MLAIVSSIVLPLLFAGTGTLAATVLVSGWRRYGPDLARLRGELAALSDDMAMEPTRLTESRVAAAPSLPVTRRAVRPVRVVAARPAPAGLRAVA